jgi:two-component system, cell cycle sensor histidine kinase and response regulator CckA
MPSKLTTDISRRKTRKTSHTKTPEVSRAPGEDYRLLFERNLAGSFRTTLDGRFLDCNEAFERVVGCESREEVMAHSAPDFHSSDASRNALIARLTKKGFLRNVEVSIRRKDGSARWVLCNLSLLRDEEGCPVVIEGTLVDITAEKQAATERQQSKSSFRLLFASNPHPMYVCDLETLELLEVNDAALAQYGYSREEFLGLRLTDIRPPHEVPHLLKNLKHAKTGLYHAGHVKHRRKDGRTLDVDVTTHRLEFDGRMAVLVVAQDITERRRTEEELRAAEAKYRTLVEQLPAISYIAQLGATGPWLYVSPQIQSLLGFSPQEWIADSGLWLKRIHPQDRDLVLAKEERVARTGENFDAEYRVIARDGRVVWFRDRGALMRDPSGRILHIQGVMLDITGTKEAEEAVARLSRQNDLILKSVGEGIYGVDVQGSCTFFNPAGAALLGWNPEDLIGKNLHDVLHHSWPDGRRYPVVECPIHSASEDGVVYHVDNEVFWRKDGTCFAVEYVRTPIREGDELVGAVVTFRDISGRKRAEEAQRQAEARFHTIFENAIEGFFQTRPDGSYVSANPALAKMYGYSSPEELMTTVNDIGEQVYVDRDRRDQFKGAMETWGVLEGFEYQVYRRDGTKIWLSENARAVRDAAGEVLYYEGTVEDITARKRGEAERQVTLEIIHGVNVTDNLDDLLRLIHQSLNKVLYAENCFVALYDPANESFQFPFFIDQYDTPPPPHRVSKSCAAYVFRTGRAMLIPQPLFDELVEAEEVELVGTPSPSWLGVPLRTPSETIGVLVVKNYVDDNAYTQRDLEFLSSVGGQIALAIERKRSEAALRESEARLRVLIEQLPAVLWTTDRDLRFTSSLGAGLIRLGLKPNQVVGMSLFDYFETTDQGFAPIAAHRRAMMGEPVTFHVEWAGGSYACHAEPLRDADGNIQGAICMSLDVTDRKQLEAQLRQAQKMEAVGRLAGGIAHDFNNLLMVIQGYTELLLEHFGQSDPLRRHAEQVHQAGERAASLTRQLLAFSRKQVLAPRVLSIDAVVADMEKMLRRLIGEDIELATVTPSDLWPVKADRSQIEQVIVNLAVNARDAMPSGGKLTIETANVELDGAYSQHRSVVVPGPYVMLAVTDTGCGMDAETQGHVFEPFFTTKEKGKGTGLGLATVYGIVKQSGGYIWLYSETGKGTTFKVYLPRVTEPLDVKEHRKEADAPRRGSETVLVAEDETGVRALTREYLESSGYQVLEAQNGAEALEIAAQHPGEIHLLLTDVVMQGISGCKLAENMVKLRPNVKVLYMSGYTDQAIVRHGILAEDTVLLQKPFTLNSLSRKLREILDPPASS